MTRPSRSLGRATALASFFVLLPFATRDSLRAAETPDVSGTWSWSWKDDAGKTHKHVLDLESAAGKLTGRERFDDLDSIKVDDLSFKDGSLSFNVTRGDRRAEYKGKLVGSKTINGIVNVVANGQAKEFQWTAERAIEVKKN